MPAPGEAIVHAVLVRAPPEACYDAFATAEGLDAWFTQGSEVDARPGGFIKLRWKDWGPDRVTTEDGGPVLVADRPRQLVFQWQPDSKAYYTTIDLRFERDPLGTVVRVREQGYRDTPAARQAMLGCATGWGEALALLKFWVEHRLRY